MSNAILIFAGTSDGRDLAEYLTKCQLDVTVCVATEYGEAVIQSMAGLNVVTGRMDVQQIKELLKNTYDCVIDATHPYAKKVTENLKVACLEMNTEYLRLVRPEHTNGNYVTVPDIGGAVDYLNCTDGTVLITTGSKELAAFVHVKDYQNRLFPRILPDGEAVVKVTELGFKRSHIICMQGPFSHDLNVAMLRQIGAKYLITKDSGDRGGLEEKLSAASQTETIVVLISRPTQESGYTFEQLTELLNHRYHLTPATSHFRFPLFIDIVNKPVTVVGGGIIATRRVLTLLQFGADIKVVSDSMTTELQQLVDQNRIKYISRKYQVGDLDQSILAVTATDCRQVNGAVAQEAKKHNIPISVADSTEQSSFYFPAVAIGHDVVTGVVSDGTNHKLVKKTAQQIRDLLNGGICL